MVITLKHPTDDRKYNIDASTHQEAAYIAVRRRYREVLTDDNHNYSVHENKIEWSDEHITFFSVQIYFNKINSKSKTSDSLKLFSHDWLYTNNEWFSVTYEFSKNHMNDMRNHYSYKRKSYEIGK